MQDNEWIFRHRLLKLTAILPFLSKRLQRLRRHAHRNLRFLSAGKIPRLFHREAAKEMEIQLSFAEGVKRPKGGRRLSFRRSESLRRKYSKSEPRAGLTAPLIMVKLRQIPRQPGAPLVQRVFAGFHWRRAFSRHQETFLRMLLTWQRSGVSDDTVSDA